LLSPAVPLSLLLGLPLDTPAGFAVGRVGGAALLSMAAACTANAAAIICSVFEQGTGLNHAPRDAINLQSPIEADANSLISLPFLDHRHY